MKTFLFSPGLITIFLVYFSVAWIFYWP